MTRDFAYTKRTGHGAVRARGKKKVMVWSWQLSLIAAVFVAVLLLFIILSSGRRDIEEQTNNTIPAPQPVATEPPTKQEESNETQGTPTLVENAEPTAEATTDTKNLNPVTSVQEQLQDLSTDGDTSQLQFYQLLKQPIDDETFDNNNDTNGTKYTVKSDLIRNQVNARSLKALLVFEGFHNTSIVQTTWNNQQWYRLVIQPIQSRSRMNTARDFLGKHDLDSTFSRIN